MADFSAFIAEAQLQPVGKVAPIRCRHHPQGPPKTVSTAKTSNRNSSSAGSKKKRRRVDVHVKKPGSRILRVFR
jgi:hypothetical protein